MCQSLYCHDPSDECIWIAPAAEYSDCDTNKWCVQGRCVLKNKMSDIYFDKKDYCL